MTRRAKPCPDPHSASGTPRSRPIPSRHHVSEHRSPEQRTVVSSAGPPRADRGRAERASSQPLTREQAAELLGIHPGRWTDGRGSNGSESSTSAAPSVSGRTRSARCWRASARGRHDRARQGRRAAPRPLPRGDRDPAVLDGAGSFAAYLQVTRRTITAWIRQGRLRAHRLSATVTVIEPAEVERFLAAHSTGGPR